VGTDGSVEDGSGEDGCSSVDGCSLHPAFFFFFSFVLFSEREWKMRK
jgi:hypothetical protein